VWLCTECYDKEAPAVLAMEREDQYTCNICCDIYLVKDQWKDTACCSEKCYAAALADCEEDDEEFLQEVARQERVAESIRAEMMENVKKWVVTKDDTYYQEAPEDQYTCGCNDKECDECQCSECGNCTDPSVKTCHHSKFCRCEDEEEPTCASMVPVSSQSATTPQTIESMD